MEYFILLEISLSFSPNLSIILEFVHPYPTFARVQNIE